MKRKKTFKLLDSLVQLEVNKVIILSAHEIKNNAKGYDLELYDCIIAATVIISDMVLVTKNTRHYPDKRIMIFIPLY